MSDEQQQDWKQAASAAGWVPPDRMSEITAERNAARQQAADARAETLELRATISSGRAAAEKEKQTLEARLKELEGASAWAESRVELAQRGISDPDVVDYLRHKYDRLETPEGKERPEFKAWLEEYAESKPAILAPFLDGQQQKPPPSRKEREAGARGVGSEPVFSDEQLANMSQADYLKHREKILSSLGDDAGAA